MKAGVILGGSGVSQNGPTKNIMEKLQLPSMNQLSFFSVGFRLRFLDYYQDYLLVTAVEPFFWFEMPNVLCMVYFSC